MKYLRSIGLTIGLSLAFSVPAFSAELEEVVVTALKREQALEEVPISVSALTPSDLKGLGLSDTVDITQQIPNFQVNTWSPNLTTLNIRGVSQNNFIDINEAPIAVYMDDIYMGTMNGISGLLFDVERIEVLRGPQGTLFGRNATGGLVHYVTRGASDEEFNLRYELGAGSFGANQLELAFGGGFGNPRYRYRFAARVDRADGYIEPDASVAATSTNLGGKDNAAYRFMTEFDISDKVRLDFNWRFTRDPRVPTGGYVLQPYAGLDHPDIYLPPEWLALFDGDVTATGNALFNPDDGFTPVNREGLTIFEDPSPMPHTNFSEYPGFLNRTTHGADIKVHYDDDNNNSFTYIAGFYRLDKFYTEDGDGIPATIINFTTTMEYTQLSQEFRFSKETEAGHHYVAGLYWMDLDYDGGAITVGAPVLGGIGQFLDDGVDPADPTANQEFFLSTINLALFGEGDFRVSDRFGIIFGARFTWDSKSINYNRTFTNDGEGLTNPDSIFEIESSFTEPDVAGRLIFNFNLGAENKHNLFLSFNRGLKSGGFNANASVTSETIDYDSESLTSVELGYKSALSETFRLSTSIFNYAYEDYQAFAILGGTPNISNADATAQGMELEIKWTPNRFVLGFGLAFMTSDVDGIQGIAEQTPPAGLPVIDFPVDILNDRQLPNAPELSFNFLLSYDVLIGSSSSWLFQLDGAWYGDQYLEVTNGGGAFQGSYSVLNFATVYRLNFGRDDLHYFDFKLYMKNLTDQVYKLYNLDLGILGSTSYYAPPQSFGFAITYGFR